MWSSSYGTTSALHSQRDTRPHFVCSRLNITNMSVLCSLSSATTNSQAEPFGSPVHLRLTSFETLRSRHDHILQAAQDSSCQADGDILRLCSTLEVARHSQLLVQLPIWVAVDRVRLAGFKHGQCSFAIVGDAVRLAASYDEQLRRWCGRGEGLGWERRG